MKNYFLKTVFLTVVLLSTKNLTAQKALKIGDEFDTNIQVTNKYQQFKKSSTTIRDKEIAYEKVFYSKNSSYIKLYFQDFDLAPGDYVEIIGDTSKESIIYGGKGKIVDTQMTTISDFWSRVLFDEKVTVKLYSSGNVGRHKGFKITKVAYGYSEEKIAEKLAESESGLKGRSICTRDNKQRIDCYRGTTMYNKAKAVCRLLIGGSSLCTGWLLGSEGNLMTNNHCINSASRARNTDYIFNYRYTNCTGSAKAKADVVASSATFIKTNGSLDYTLIKLPVNPTNKYGYLSLSKKVPAKGDRIYIPQHPGGRRKEISVKSDRDATAGGFSRVYQSRNGSGQQVRYYADTEGGSSGSPVLDYKSNLVIAIHNTGGCPNGSYGRCDNLIRSIGTAMPKNGVGGGSTTPPAGCTSTVNKFPYNQSFENTLGKWKQNTNDNFQWTLKSGGTPSNNTGPASANDGSYYLYVESSAPNSPNKKAIVTSPCFNVSNINNATLTFKYHMYGAASMGSLRVQLSKDNGKTWSKIWEKKGNQGNSWKGASINLSSYTGKIMLRFNGITGDNWQGDMAIDKLAITSGGGTDPDPVCKELNFNDYRITSFGDQDKAGDYSIDAKGTSLTLTNNTWKQIAMNYTVTKNTVIEFEFSSTSEGEIHGIGFEDDSSLTSTRYFKVYGIQDYGITNFNNYSSGTKKYVIPVGSSYTGKMDKLVFINDHDTGSGNTSTFSKLKIYEGSCGNFGVLAESLETRIDVIGQEDEDLFSSIKIAPNPIKRGAQLRLLGADKELYGATFSVINTLGQELIKGNLERENSITTDKLKSGVYILRLENKFTKASKRFIVE
ncbi:trypsin-like peptidase domain-containing protein [Tenacibaculum amylolyticum]|uniref:trypsin-like peptidase domain-containing protein n=1 Tax=Tenacibaculum amylolyticum TaxID=104269 RepID=UPI003892F263